MMQSLSVMPMLDFLASNIQKLIYEKRWESVDTYNRIKQIYDFLAGYMVLRLIKSSNDRERILKCT